MNSTKDLLFTLINLSMQKPKSFWVKKPDSSKGTVLHRLQANEQAQCYAVLSICGNL